MTWSLRSVLLLLFLLMLGCRTIGRGSSATQPEGGPAAMPELVPAPEGMFAYTDPGQLPQLVIASEGEPASSDARPARLPLKHTDVDARVRGHVAQVRVTQQFHNDREQPIEVTYTFPLPENAAVDGMRMIIGERTIESEVQTRAQARETFEDARRDGHTAALLEQERPNIFTQSLTNVPPGETIEVELTYLQTLTQDGSTFEFVFPMVVGPRFVGGRVASLDAKRINPPILGEGLRTGHDVSLAISVDAGAAVENVVAPTHAVTSSMSARGFDARLRDSETIPNRDFVLRWQLAGSSASATLFTSKPQGDGHGHFALVIQPPQLDLDAVVGRRELIFVVDRSGSMSGLPLALAKQTLRESLKRLRPVDTFNVIGFESGTERLFDRPRPANDENLVLAERFIDGMEASGGTMIADAVEAALAPELAPGVQRYVMFLTDGYIGNEAEIFAGAAKLVRRAKTADSRARVFGVGIGAAPNRELIAGLSKAGDGAALYVGNREHPSAAVDGFFRLVDHPVLEHVAIDWGQAAIEDVYPNRHLNLFASRSVVVLGRYRGELSEAVTVRATIPSTRTRVELPVTIVDGDVDDRILTTLWARAKLAELDAASWDGDLSQQQARAAITQIGLQYRLVTAYTSFVAVDRSRVIGDGQPDRITQPVEVPEDVDAEQAGAREIIVKAPSLLGVTEVGSHYTVDSFAISNPSRSIGSATIMQEYVEVIAPDDGSLFDPLDYHRSSWDATATLRIKRIDGSEGVDERALEKALKAHAMKVEACYEQRWDGSNRQRLRVRLRFDAHGQLLDIELLDGSLGTDADACVEAVLRKVAWRGLPSADATVTIELRLRMW